MRIILSGKDVGCRKAGNNKSPSCGLELKFHSVQYKAGTVTLYAHHVKECSKNASEITVEVSEILTLLDFLHRVDSSTVTLRK